MRDIYAQVTASIIQKLDSGTVPWRMTWNAAPTNYISRKPYRGINVWLLHSEYSSPLWLTYRQAMQIGGHVRRGEHGTSIIYWKWMEEEIDVDGTVKTTSYPLLRSYTVFNVEQCEGVQVDTAVIEPVASAEEIIRGYEDAPPIEFGGGRASYRPSNDVIYMPHRDSFESSAAYYSTLFHECVHSTGHESRLRRILDTHYHSEAYSREELIAEMGSAFLCAISSTELVASTIDNAAAYIDHWRSKFLGNRHLIMHLSISAQKACNWILPSDEAGASHQ